MSEALDAIEETVEETLDKVESVIDYRHFNVSLPVAVAVGVLAFGGGIAVGFLLGRRPRKLTPSEMAELNEISNGLEELKAQKGHPTRVVVDEEYLARRDAEFVESGLKVGDTIIDPEDGQEGTVVAIYDPEEPEPEPIIPTPVTINQEVVRRSIFAEQADPEDDWDYAVEIKLRNPARPYPIHRDEFFSDEDDLDHHQHQLTFYNGDGVLVDEERNPIQSIRDVVGEMKFGHGSGDPNVVYIRNERLKADYEIWLDSGRYDVEVQGADMEDVLEHQDRRNAVRKFRQE